MIADEISSIAQWREVLDVKVAPAFGALGGWNTISSSVPNFVEPRLRRRSDLGGNSASVFLVSASGAVGKSTYASEIAAQLGMVLLDLSRASPVAGNYLSGGLVATGLISSFQAGFLGIVIDALDEAKLRVTGESYQAFIEDVARLSKTSSSPIILLGRESAIEEAWLTFDQSSVQPVVFEILRFNREQAVRFVMTRLDTGLQGQGLIAQHRGVFEKKAREIIDRLTQATNESEESDTLDFAGYAPVLEAVAAYIERAPNPAAPLDFAETGVTLVNTIVERLLTRESDKVRDAVVQKIPGAALLNAYSPEEQRRLILSHLQSEPTKVNVVSTIIDVQQAYEDAVQGLLHSHPFLDGTGKRASSAVFEADLLLTLLGKGGGEFHIPVGLRNFSKPGNPFLIDLYLARKPEQDLIPPEHVGHLLASAQALLSAGQVTDFSFVQDEDDQPDADVGIVIRRLADATIVRQWLVKSHVAGRLTFLSTLANAVVDAEVDVLFGNNNTGATASAMVDIDCAALTIHGSELMISVPREAAMTVERVVSLAGVKLDAAGIQRIRVIGDGSLLINFPEAKDYPWSQYYVETADSRQQDWDRKLALRRILGVFKAGSTGELRLPDSKMDSKRMTKGWGLPVREALIRDGVLRKLGNWYYLEPAMMGQVLGISYTDVAKRQFGSKADEWIRTVQRDGG